MFRRLTPLPVAVTPLLVAVTLLACNKADKQSEPVSTVPPAEGDTRAEDGTSPKPGAPGAGVGEATPASPAGGEADKPSPMHAAGSAAAAAGTDKAPPAPAPAPAPDKSNAAVEAARLAGNPGGDAVAQGKSCVDGKACAPGLECIEYYGFAGPAGPKFASCEIRCKSAVDCPKGQTCTTISDGPGSVCR